MVLAAFLILFAAIAGSLCSLWGRPGEGIGIPVIAVSTFAFIYLFEPLYMIAEGHSDYFLNEDMLVRGLLLAAAALLCLMWG